MNTNADQWDMEVDVLVIGAGGCGLTAAIAAHDDGAAVAIVEKRDQPGGNTSLSTGSIPGAGSRFQRAAQIEDSPETLKADLLRITGEHDLTEVSDTLVAISAELCEWLVDSVPARMSLITDYCHVGHTVPRLHAPASRRGQDLMDDLLAGVAQRDIPLATGNPVQSLLTSAQGEVIGALIGGKGVETTRIKAGKVILACNGFAGNRALVKEFCPEIAGAEYFGALGSEGEAVAWGRELGAGLANMSAYQGYAAVAYPHGSILSWTTIEKGGVLVNAGGQRFGNEDLGYSAYARMVLAQQGEVYAIFDDRIKAIASKEDEFRELVELGGVKSAATVAELAAFFRLPAETLTQTIEAYNKAAAGGADDTFGRRHFNVAPMQGPYWICRVTPGLFHTQGGLAIDPVGRVLKADGTAIPNLFAGGGAAGGISGRAGAGGYASGNGLLTAIGLGYLSGKAAAKEIRDEQA
ncbi:MAG: FAD-dependent oxidoreductase [Pseudomonadota bacterium]